MQDCDFSDSEIKGQQNSIKSILFFFFFFIKDKTPKTEMYQLSS